MKTNFKNELAPALIELNRMNEELQAENEKLKGELQQSATNCNKLRYALARLRWEHAGKVESLIDQLYTERPSSWNFYYKSKKYWFNKWQEFKKELKEK